MTRCTFPIIVGLLLFVDSFPKANSDPPSPRQGSTLTVEELRHREGLAGNDPVKLLDLAGLVEAKEGRRLLHKVVGVLAEVPPALQEMLPISNQFAKVLPRLAAYPDEVQDIFATKGRKQVARQVVYRRVLEQWLIDHPLSLTIVFEGAKGQELRLQTVQPGSNLAK